MPQFQTCRVRAVRLTHIAVAATAVLILCGVLALAPRTGSAANSYYVATSGNNSNPGTQSQPFKTIQKAATVAGAGDTVFISAGTYPETVSIDQSGTAGSPIVFRALGNGPVWVDGACTRTNGFAIVADYITIIGIGVKKANEANIELDASNHITLDSLTIQDWACAGGDDQFRAGVASWSGGSHLTITNSYFERRIELSGSDVGYGNAIWLKNTGANYGGFHFISGNTIVGGYDGIGGEPEDVNWGAFNKDSVIENNTISDCADDGLQVEGGTKNVVVRGNSVKRCLIGIAFAPALTGPLTIERNVISEPVERYGLGAAMFKVGDSSIGEVRVYHNSFYAGSTPADGLKQTNANMKNIHLKNNAIFSSRYVIETGSHTGPVTADHDALRTSDSSRFVKWDNSTYNPLSSFVNATGQEDDGLSPILFMWDSQLRPLVGSPLIDAGVLIPGTNDGYAGLAPDIGAFEFGAGGGGTATATPTAAPSVTATPTPSPSPSKTPTPSPSPSKTPTPSPSPSKTPTPSPSPSKTPTLAPTASKTPTPSATLSLSPTASKTAAPTKTATLTPSPKPTKTPKATKTPTPTPSPSPTPAKGKVKGVRGDADCNGRVNTADVNKIMSISLGFVKVRKCAGQLDLNCDTGINETDALILLNEITKARPIKRVRC